MITQFKIFENTEDPKELIGRKAILIDKTDALYDDDHGDYMNSDNNIGWEFHIFRAKKINYDVLISEDGDLFYNIKNFKIKEIKREYKENDPYGEEDWANESIAEEIEIERSLFKIFDHYITFDRVLEYLKKELIGKIVTVSSPLLLRCEYKNGNVSYTRDRDIKVKNIILNEKHLLFHFIDENDNDYMLPDNAYLKWKTRITRNSSQEDPYGEEDWDL
jgi:hypothetical protein